MLASWSPHQDSRGGWQALMCSSKPGPAFAGLAESHHWKLDSHVVILVHAFAFYFVLGSAAPQRAKGCQMMPVDMPLNLKDNVHHR